MIGEGYIFYESQGEGTCGRYDLRLHDPFAQAAPTQGFFGPQSWSWGSGVFFVKETFHYI